MAASIFGSVRVGRYRVSAVMDRAERGQKRQEYHLDVIDVAGDRTDLVLRPIGHRRRRGTGPAYLRANACLAQHRFHVE